MALKALFHTLLCVLTLSTSTHALAWEATIERDALGVPHIFGETDADMAYGLAWAQSEDGWEILEETLPYYRGNAASFFGRDAAVGVTVDDEEQPVPVTGADAGVAPPSAAHGAIINPTLAAPLTAARLDPGDLPVT